MVADCRETFIIDWQLFCDHSPGRSTVQRFCNHSPGCSTIQWGLRGTTCTFGTARKVLGMLFTHAVSFTVPNVTADPDTH